MRPDNCILFGVQRATREISTVFLEDVLDPVLGRDYLVDASGQRITAAPAQVA